MKNKTSLKKTKKKILIQLKSFLENPKTSLAIGLVLLFCGIFETSETVLEAILGFEIGIHHGITIYAIAQVLLAITHILEGIDDISVAQLAEDIEDLEDDLSHQKSLRIKKRPSSHSILFSIYLLIYWFY